VFGTSRQDPRLLDVLLLVLAVGGLAMCITLVSQGMRAVMDVGGACAEGGPYEIAQPCPEGTAPAMLLGIFGGFGFGALGMVYGSRVGGYGWLPLLAWTGLFASLGWNFLDYGLVNPPEGEGIVWGWLIPGLLFEVMAWAPVVFLVMAWRDARADPPGAGLAGVGVERRWLRRPGQPMAAGSAAPRTAVDVERDETADAATDFSEGTQALLDRLERLADMRDRGLLAADEYETAKDAVMRELEARS
jgi:hypothetical protein